MVRGFRCCEVNSTIDASGKLRCQALIVDLTVGTEFSGAGAGLGGDELGEGKRSCTYTSKKGVILPAIVKL